MKTSPTQLTLRELKKATEHVQVVERWCPFSRRRKDLFEVIDVLALVGNETVAVQTTSWANVSARAKKMAECKHLPAMREAGWKILIHGWRKSKSTNRYELKCVDIS